MKNFILCLLLAAIATDKLVLAQEKTSQNVLTLSLAEAKQKLIKENLRLVAAYYDIGAAEADLIQAKLWANPYLVWNQDLYSIEKNDYFNFTRQRLIQINQTFSVAGKHTNTVKLAKINIELNRLMLQDVLRSLVYELGEKYLALNALQQKQNLYETTLTKYEELIRSSENKLRVGAIPLNEVTRLKSELIAVRTEATHNKNDILSETKEMKNLLNISENIDIQTINKKPDSVLVLNIDGLMNEGLASRADFLLSQKQIQYEERNLKLQKSIAMPDIMLGYQPSDKGSNYVRTYSGLVLEMNVPIFDRNQGNIKRAKVKIEQAKANNSLSELQIRNEIQQSYQELLNDKRGFEQFSDAFLQTIEEMNRNAINNYDKKNINLLEYIDLQRIYIQNKIQYIELQNEYQHAINQLNFTVGKEVIN